MKYVLIAVLGVLMILVVVNLVRGIVAFLRTSHDELSHTPGSGPTPSQVAQNSAMMKRILFQGAAIAVVALLLAATG